MARKRARRDEREHDREFRKSVRKGGRRLGQLARGLARVERKLVKAQVILTETAVRASDLEDRVEDLRAALGRRAGRGDGSRTARNREPEGVMADQAPSPAAGSAGEA